MGQELDYPTSFSREDWYGLRNAKIPHVQGLLKFEAKVIWCDEDPKGSVPHWEAYASNVVITRVDKKGRRSIREKKIDEFRDGPSVKSSRKDIIRNLDGTYTTIAYDTPRLSVPFYKEKKYRYYLTGDWRIRLSYESSIWETTISLGFVYDDDANSSTIGSSFKILSPPRKIK